MKRLSYYAAVFSSVFVIFAFSGRAFASVNVNKNKSGSAHQVTAAADHSASSTLAGKVVETMNSGGYTYVRIEKNGKKIWVAVPEMKVAVGQKVVLRPGMEMKNFTSKSLNRTFKSIIFSGGPAASQGSPALPPGHMNISGSASGSKAALAPAEKNIKVKKAAGKHGFTVGEIFAKRASLNKKTVVVRAKVVKVSAGIMGMNWLHLQDGTGDAKKSTHDLVATTQDLPKVGDVVTVKGTVAKDKDFGAGYKYSVILEKASVQH